MSDRESSPDWWNENAQAMGPERPFVPDLKELRRAETRPANDNWGRLTDRLPEAWPLIAGFTLLVLGWTLSITLIVSWFR